MAGQPIPLGSARTGALIPDIGSSVATNDYGIDEGRVRHSLGDQSLAQQRRPKRGGPYAGTLPQFKGMFVDRSAIVGAEGKACFVDVDYKALNSGWGIQPPEQSAEMEVRDLTSFGDNLFTSGRGQTLHLPHPVLTYKFADTKPSNKRGTYALELPNAPTIGQFEFEVIWINSVQGEDGNISITTRNNYSLIFSPHPSGWFCMKDDCEPLCGGRLFQIEQQWKRFYLWTGYNRHG
jgi:hypothetical protein